MQQLIDMQQLIVLILSSRIKVHFCGQGSEVNGKDMFNNRFCRSKCD